MTTDKAKFLRVTDSSCTAENPERRHHISVRGELKEIVFKFGEAVILPFEHAIKFMISGFKVEETDGKPVNLPAVAAEGVQATLAADEVIAKLSELTLASLKIRAGQRPGGEVYLDADETAHGDIIAFLLGKPPAGEDETKTETAGDDDLIEDDEADANGGAGLVPAAPGPVTSPFTDDKNPDSTLGTLDKPSLPPVPAADVGNDAAAETPPAAPIAPSAPVSDGAAGNGASTQVTVAASGDAQSATGSVTGEPILPALFDEAKYGGTFTEVMNGLLTKFGAEDYVSEPESGIYRLGGAQDGEIVSGTLDELIAMEGVNPPEPKVLATSGAQELAATVNDPDNTFAALKPADGSVVTEADVAAHIAANDLQPKDAPAPEKAPE